MSIVGARRNCSVVSEAGAREFAAKTNEILVNMWLFYLHESMLWICLVREAVVADLH